MYKNIWTWKSPDCDWFDRQYDYGTNTFRPVFLLGGSRCLYYVSLAGSMIMEQICFLLGDSQCLYYVSLVVICIEDGILMPWYCSYTWYIMIWVWLWNKYVSSCFLSGDSQCLYYVCLVVICIEDGILMSWYCSYTWYIMICIYLLMSQVLPP